MPILAQMGPKMDMKMGPKIDFEPTSVREPWHEESIGHVFFQFRTKIRCQPPSHTSFPRQKSAKNRFFLGDVFVFCLDFFDMLNGSSRCEAICAPFFWTSALVIHFANPFICSCPRSDGRGGSSRAHARALRLVGAGMSGFSPACA